MSIFEFAVKKPVSMTMLYIAILLLGIRSFNVLPQELFPPLTFPQLTIVTSYGNASPEEIETLVTKILEETVATVKGLKTLRSFSKEGLSVIIVEFQWGTDMDFASLNLREKIDLVKERMPREAEEPLVLKFNPFAKPIMVYSMTSHGDPKDPNYMLIEDLLKLAKTKLKDKLEKVPGVASLSISGGLEKEIQVDLSLQQLVGHKINIQDIPTALKDSNLNYPAGSVKEDFFEYLVRTMGEFTTIKDIGDCLISIENIKRGKYDRAKRKEQEKKGERGSEKEEGEDISSQYVFLKDVGTIQENFKERSSYSRYQGKENISLQVQKQASANIIETVAAVKAELFRLQNETNMIPASVDLKLIYDESVFIQTSIDGVISSVIEGGILAFITLYLFLHSLKSATIVCITIPYALIITIIGMEYFKYSVNMMTLAGLALGVSMMVDGSVVVQENIDRHKSEGKDKETAAIDASAEIFAPLLSGILTNVVVFLPLGYVIGIAGQLFKPISFTVIGPLLASLFVGVTLIPRLSTIEIGKAGPPAESGPIMKKVERVYRKLLGIFLGGWYIPGFFFVIAALAAALYLLSISPSETMPKVDQRSFNIKMTLPTGTLLDITNDTATLIEKELNKEPEIESVSIAVGSDRSAGRASVESLGSHQAMFIVRLKAIPKDNIMTQVEDALTGANLYDTFIKERPFRKSTTQVVGEMRERVDKVRNSDVNTAMTPALQNAITSLKTAEIVWTTDDNPFAGAFSSSAPIAIQVTGRDLNLLQTYVSDVEKLLEKIPGTINIRNDIPSKSPEIRIIPNRKRAAMQGLSSSDIAQTSLICIKGMPATKLKKDGNETEVIVRLRKEDRESITALENLSLFSEDRVILMKDVATIKAGRGPSEVKRLDQIRIFNVFADLKGRAEGDAIRELKPLLKAMPVEDNYSIGFGREYEEKQESQMSLIYAFAISVALVYMIMASQFESLLQPFIIMMTVPLSIIGVGFTLYFTGTSVNAMSMLGVIILAGVVVSNGIILIDFVNQLRGEGQPLKEALINAGGTRLRPILITNISGVLGLVPMAMKWEEGSDFQAPMATAVIGGQIISMCLTLFIIPSIYLVVESFLLYFKKNKQKAAL